MLWMFMAGMALAKPVNLSIELDDEDQFDTEVRVDVSAGPANMSVQIGTHEVIERGGSVGTDTIVFHSEVQYVAIDAIPPGANETVRWDSRIDGEPPALLGDAAKVLGQQFRVTFKPDLSTSIGAIDGGPAPGEPLGLAQALQLIPTGEHDVGEPFTSSPILGKNPVTVDWIIDTYKKKVAIATCKATSDQTEGSISCSAQIDTKRHVPQQVSLSASRGPQNMRLKITITPSK